MNEIAITYQAFGAMIGLSLSTLAYSLGGRAGGGGKWVRRYLGSLILAMTVNILFLLRGHWSPWFLAVWPLLIGGFSMGYSGNDLGLAGKLIKRAIYALGVVSSGLLLALVLGGYAWLLLALHIFLGLLSVVIGAKNPLKDAAAEEVLVCAVLNLILVFYPFLV